MDTHVLVQTYKDLLDIFWHGNILQNCNITSHRVPTLMSSTDLIQCFPVLTVLVYVCAHLVQCSFSCVGFISTSTIRMQNSSIPSATPLSLLTI